MEDEKTMVFRVREAKTVIIEKEELPKEVTEDGGSIPETEKPASGQD